MNFIKLQNLVNDSKKFRVGFKMADGKIKYQGGTEKCTILMHAHTQGHTNIHGHTQGKIFI